jgi:hypothetical protein
MVSSNLWTEDSESSHRFAGVLGVLVFRIMCFMQVFLDDTRGLHVSK